MTRDLRLAHPHPCPWCGRRYSMAIRYERGVMKGSKVKCRDIEDHDCPAFRREPGSRWEDDDVA